MNSSIKIVSTTNTATACLIIVVINNIDIIFVLDNIIAIIVDSIKIIFGTVITVIKPIIKGTKEFLMMTVFARFKT